MVYVARQVAEAINDLVKRAFRVLTATIFIGVVVFCAQAFGNRSPPFALLSVDKATARPGDYVRIYASVWRDPSRQCSVSYDRYMYDRDGMRYDMGSSSASAQSIKEKEAETPGRLAIAVQLPSSIVPGRARVLTELAYRCNHAQQFFPIEVLATLPFYVLPPP